MLQGNADFFKFESKLKKRRAWKKAWEKAWKGQTVIVIPWASDKKTSTLSSFLFVSPELMSYTGHSSCLLHCFVCEVSAFCCELCTKGSLSLFLDEGCADSLDVVDINSSLEE